MTFGEACKRYNKYHNLDIIRIDDIERFKRIENMLKEYNCKTTEELIQKLNRQMKVIKNNIK